MPEHFPELSGAGLGLRRALLGPLQAMDRAAVDFMEVAPENWIGVGGRYGRQLRQLAERFTQIQGGLTAVERLIDHGLGRRPDGQVLTASIGIAERIGDQAQSHQQLLELADKRMYRAKMQGRNQLCTNTAEIRSAEVA